MSLEKTIEVVSKLADQGTIKRYAIADAVAALNYILPTLTEDLDILVSLAEFEKRESGLERFDLMPAWKGYCAKAGKLDFLE